MRYTVTGQVAIIHRNCTEMVIYDIELNLTGSLKLVLTSDKLFAALSDPRCNFFDCTDTSVSMSGNDYALAQTRETSPPTLSCFLREASIVSNSPASEELCSLRLLDLLVAMT